MFRSLIFVPGNSARFLAKASTLAADIVCFDLEDSVPLNEKELARKMIAATLQQQGGQKRSIYIRTNSFESGMVSEDLKAVLNTGVTGVVIPKVNDKSEVTKAAEIVSALEKGRGIEEGSIRLVPSIETARGVVNAYDIALSSGRVNALVFGVFDFLYDMRLDYNEGNDSSYWYARSKVPVDARAAGVQAIDAIWQKIDDIDGLIKDAATAKRLGYSGKSIIHPSQIEHVHRVFVPSKNEIEWARKVVAALGEAMEKGSGRGAVRLEGRMIDAVHYKQARVILEAEKEAAKEGN
jgi:citrate lyase subunit beta/citryl-CoA lyase